MAKRKLHLSASAIAAFKSCPIRFKNAYHLGIRREGDTEAQRIGTNWHRICDIITRKPESVCERCAKKAITDQNCSLCAGTGYLPKDLMDAVTRELVRLYSYESAATEQTKLLYSLSGYRWYYEDQPEEVVTREQRFELSLRNPETGRALPGVKLVGMIDKIIKWNGRPAIKEHKSTSSSVDPDSDYWGHLNLDTQTKLYLYTVRRMQADGELVPWGIRPEDPPINTILYDAYHKPSIKPKKLTQAESKKFVDGVVDDEDDGVYHYKYMGQWFEVCSSTDDKGFWVQVNGVQAEVELGKKEGTFAIRETPEMYGARLLTDISERPEFYFRCVEITRTDKEMEAFEWELYNIYRTMQTMIKTGHWYGDEHQCENRYKCDYLSFCYNSIELTVDNIPEGMKCIFKKEKK